MAATTAILATVMVVTLVSITKRENTGETFTKSHVVLRAALPFPF